MKPYFTDESVTLWHGDALAVLRELPDASVDCCVTSPPYFGLRDYGETGQYGLEASPAEYVETMRAVFADVRRVLADDGTLWLNIGDSYSAGNGSKTSGPQQSRNGHGVCGPRDQHPSAFRSAIARFYDGVPPAKNLLGIPWRVAFALQDDGWILRNDIIWQKPNAMPESVTDRLSSKHEYLFMFSKSARYWFDLDPIRTPPGDGRNPPAKSERKYAFAQGGKGSINQDGWTAGPTNPGDVWSIPTVPFSAAHFAAFPPLLAERAILAGCKLGTTERGAGVVLDPFSGSGTTGLAATKHGRRYVGIDLNAEYLDLSLRTRLGQATLTTDGEAS